MTVNHIAPQFITAFTFEPAGFVSAAEGFVFISGLAAGLIAARGLARQLSPAAACSRFLGRARQLYLLHLLLFTAMFSGAWFGGDLFGMWRHSSGMGGGHPACAWLLGTVFLNQPPEMDILPMYCLFLLTVPWSVRQISAGRTWLPLTLSAGLWCLGQAVCFPAVSWISHPGYFNVAAWQFLFVLGVALGFRYQRDGRPHGSWSGLAVALVLCAALFALRHPIALRLHLIWSPLPNLDALTGKSTLGVLRLLNFLAIAYALRFIWRRWGGTVEGSLPSRALAYLGRHSLAVFAWSIVLSYMGMLDRQSWHRLPRLPILIAVACAVLSLWLPAWLHALQRALRRGTPYPAAAAAGG